MIFHHLDFHFKRDSIRQEKNTPGGINLPGASANILSFCYPVPLDKPSQTLTPNEANKLEKWRFSLSITPVVMDLVR
jgi:hypothetical protein